MAESNKSGGILALAQKRLARTKTKVLQNLGKAEKTTDDAFNDIVLKTEKQQEVAHHLQKELKNYIHCLRDLSHATKSLHTALSETYEEEWTSEPTFKGQIQTFDLLWNDYLQNIQDTVVLPMNHYLQSFPVLKNKVAKRGRKMVDFDNSRHQLEVLQSAKKKDDAKIQKAQEELKDAKRIYDELNNELHTELPEFYNSRVTFYASLFTSLFGAEQNFHSSVGKTSETLGDISQQLAKDFKQFAYQPKRPVSTSMSTNSADHGPVNGDTSSSPPTPVTGTPLSSAATSPIKESPQPVYNNEDVPDTKQTNGESSPKEQMKNGTDSGSDESAASAKVGTSDKSSSEVPDHAAPQIPDENKNEKKMNDKKDDDSSDEDKKAGDNSNLYEEPKEAASSTPGGLAPPSQQRENPFNHKESPVISSDEDDDYTDDEAQEPTYSNPPSNKPATAPPPHLTTYLYTVEATHKYTREDVDELSFEPGDIIYVIKFENPDEQDDGWQMGVKECDGVKGVFPENFTQKL